MLHHLLILQQPREAKRAAPQQYLRNNRRRFLLLVHKCSNLLLSQLLKRIRSPRERCFPRFHRRSPRRAASQRDIQAAEAEEILHSATSARSQPVLAEKKWRRRKV